MVVVDNPFGKYAHPEVERKFLVATMPSGSSFSAAILDHYIPNTTLRLRRMQTEHEVTFKLAQKFRAHPHETRVIFHTNFYLSEAEYVLFVSTLPSHRLEKRRFRFHGETLPMSIDQFQGPLDGLVIAEVDFGPNGDPASLPMPSFALAEVTDDERLTGARLALTTPSQVKALLDEFNVKRKAATLNGSAVLGPFLFPFQDLLSFSTESDQDPVFRRRVINQREE